MADNSGPGAPLPPGFEVSTDNPFGLPLVVPSGGPAPNTEPVEPVDPMGADGGSVETPDPAPADVDDVPDEAVETVQALQNAANSMEMARSAYEEAYQALDCDFCMATMDVLRQADFETQIAGLRELVELESMSEDELTGEDINEHWEEFEVIPEVSEMIMEAQNADG